MSITSTALFVGLVLGLTAAFGSFGQFVIVLLFGLIGLAVGAVLDGKLDVAGLIERTRR